MRMIDSPVIGWVSKVLFATAPLRKSLRYGMGWCTTPSAEACGMRERAFTVTDAASPPRFTSCTLNVPTNPSEASPMMYVAVPSLGFGERSNTRPTVRNSVAMSVSYSPAEVAGRYAAYVYGPTVGGVVSGPSTPPLAYCVR